MTTHQLLTAILNLPDGDIYAAYLRGAALTGGDTSKKERGGLVHVRSFIVFQLLKQCLAESSLELEEGESHIMWNHGTTCLECQRLLKIRRQHLELEQFLKRLERLDAQRPWGWR